LREVSAKLKGKLVISIVAGLDSQALETAAGPDVRVVRVMPNTPALVGQGAAAYSLGNRATEGDAVLVEKILRGVGLAVRVKESLLDAVTGLSGSGPAYVFTVIEALADGGVLMGLPRDLALKLAAQTVAGAAAMVRDTGEHPAVLRDQVTSPGGTTIAGLEELESGGLRSALISAVRAATERSRQLR
jgi:pyrroline-5-carboxylate reductase